MTIGRAFRAVIDGENCTNSQHENRVANDELCPEMITQLALDATGVGIFNYKIIIFSGLICMKVQLDLMNLGFILTMASCDLQMNTIDKGQLASSFVLGLMIGGYTMGSLADVYGRKCILSKCLFLHSSIQCLASLISHYWTIVVLMVIAGAALGGELTIVFTYLGEFQPSSYRKRALSYMPLSFPLGTTLSPVVAWLVVQTHINIEINNFIYHSWNLILIVSTIPTWIGAFWVLFLPETPKYLSECGKNDELYVVLSTIYRQNTRKLSSEYFAELHTKGIASISEISKQPEDDRTSKIVQFLKSLICQTIQLLKRPYLWRTFVDCVVMFCIYSPLYTLSMWLPILFDKISNFKLSNPGAETRVCTVTETMSYVNKTQGTITELGDCVDNIDNDVFIHTLSLGVTALLIAIIIPFIIDYIGFKICLIISMVLSGCTILGLFFAHSSLEIVIATSLFQGMVSLAATVICSITVEIFPTKLRGSASALSSLSARAGAFIGNIIFSNLIDHYCMISIIFLTAELIVGAIFAMFLPKNNDR